MVTRRFESAFVTSVPAEPADGVLYVSIEYKTAIHLCACGCGHEVVTPIGRGRRGWTITYDGEAVSPWPSVGNHGFPCQSHYWIGQGGWVRWDTSWSEAEVARARKGDGDERMAPQGWWGALTNWLRRSTR